MRKTKILASTPAYTNNTIRNRAERNGVAVDIQDDLFDSTNLIDLNKDLLRAFIPMLIKAGVPKLPRASDNDLDMFYDTDKKYAFTIRDLEETNRDPSVHFWVNSSMENQHKLFEQYYNLIRKILTKLDKYVVIKKQSTLSAEYKFVKGPSSGILEVWCFINNIRPSSSSIAWKVTG